MLYRGNFDYFLDSVDVLLFSYINGMQNVKGFSCGKEIPISVCEVHVWEEGIEL